MCEVHRKQSSEKHQFRREPDDGANRNHVWPVVLRGMRGWRGSGAHGEIVANAERQMAEGQVASQRLCEAPSL